jgi:hypothetical protein
MSVRSLNTVENVSLSLKDKDSDEYLKMMTDSIMMDLLRYNGHLQKAYNYYEGIRDLNQYKHITDKYGLGTATDLRFVPLIQQHIDYLVSEFIGNDIEYSITCNDKSTLLRIEEEKRKMIYEKEIDEIRAQLNNSLRTQLEGQEQTLNSNPGPQNADPEYLQKHIEKTISEEESGYISEYEEAAQLIIESVKNNRQADLQFLRMKMAQDLLITNRCYHRIYSEGTDRLEIEWIDPRDVFHDFNKKSPYVKDVSRIIYREWVSRSEAVARYGHALTEEEREQILNPSNNMGSYFSNSYYLSSTGATGIMGNTGIGEDTIDNELYDYSTMQTNQLRLIPIHHCEWLDTSEVNDDKITDDMLLDTKKKKKKKYRQDRYSTIVIGHNIYILTGRDDNAPRSASNPMLTRLSVNGLYFPKRSLVMRTMDLQDMYDILHFHLEFVIANSGVKGAHWDISQLPTFLGEDPKERLVKAEGYRKQGSSLWDSASEEREGMPLNNTLVNGFDDTLSSDTVNAYMIAINQLELQISQYTGVFKNSLVNGIGQRDAVTNVETGFKQEAILTRKYFALFDLEMKELYNDIINVAQIAYKDGFVGNYIMGPSLSKVFVLKPDQFTHTDYNIHIGDSSDLIKEKELIRQMSLELTKADKVDPRLIMDMITSKSLSKMKRDVLHSIDEKEKKDGITVQLQQQLQQVTQQLKQMTAQLQEAQKENRDLNNQNVQAQMQIEQAKLQLQDKNINVHDEHYQRADANDKEKTKIEQMQLFDNSKRNDEINYR